MVEAENCEEISTNNLHNLLIQQKILAFGHLCGPYIHYDWFTF